MPSTRKKVRRSITNSNSRSKSTPRSKSKSTSRSKSKPKKITKIHDDVMKYMFNYLSINDVKNYTKINKANANKKTFKNYINNRINKKELLDLIDNEDYILREYGQIKTDLISAYDAKEEYKEYDFDEVEFENEYNELLSIDESTLNPKNKSYVNEIIMRYYNEDYRNIYSNYYEFMNERRGGDPPSLIIIYDENEDKKELKKPLVYYHDTNTINKINNNDINKYIYDNILKDHLLLDE